MEKEAALSPAPAALDPYEARLVALAKERAPEAWDEIYARNYPPVYRYVRARVFDESTADDLASSVFLAAVKGIASYQYRGQPLLAWLYRIARNVVGDYQRSLFRQKVGSIGVLDFSGRVFRRSRNAETAITAGSDADTVVEHLDLREAMMQLPEAQREALVLKFFVGLEAKEIATLVGKDPAAVYSLQARGLQALRRHLH